MREYRKGYRFERRVRKYLEKLGYIVFRAAGSKPIDLIVITRRKGFIIECKVSRKYLRKNDISRLMYIHEKTGLIPVFAYRENNEIKFLNLLDNKIFNFPHAESLDKFIGTF